MVDERVPGAVTGKVAQIVSDQEVILNRGSDQGITEGDYFAILDPKTLEVEDPETSESLGGIRKVKIVVRVTSVAPKLSLARTFRTRRVNVGGNGYGGISSIVAAMGEAPRWVDEVETFASPEDGPRQISPSESIVRIGDPIEKLPYSSSEQGAVSVLVDQDEQTTSLEQGRN